MLCDEAERGDVTALRQLIEEGGDVEERNAVTEYTPLHLACMFGHLNCAQLLVECGADVNAQDHQNATPLHMAATHGRINCIALLLHTAADVDAEDINRETPLHYAAHDGKDLCAHALVHAGADVEIENFDGESPRDVAQDEGHFQIAWLLDTTFHSKEMRAMRWRSLPSEQRMRIIKSAESHHMIMAKKNVLMIDGHVDMPPQFTTICENAFQLNKKVQSVVLQPGTKRIEAQAFTNCSNLRRIEIPDTVEFIGHLAFKECNRLKSVVISSRCKLGEGAFEPCTTISNQWDRAPTEADKMPSVLKSAAFIDAPPPSEAKLDPVARRWT